MTMFAVGVAALLALALWMLRPALRPAAAAAFVTPQLDVMREQLAALDRERDAGQLDAAQHQLARSELQRRVLEESAPDGAALVHTAGARWPLIAVGLAVPAFALALYGAIGNPAGLTAEPAPAAQAATDAEVSPEAVLAMLATLEQRLEKPSGNPTADLQGWTMLARSYAALQRFADADRAYARAIVFAPGDAQLLADRADVLSMLQGQRTDGEPDRLIAEALRIDPHNLKALAIAGSAAFERKDFGAARAYWQQARELTPDGSAFAAGLDRSLAELPNSTTAPTAGNATTTGGGGGAPAAAATQVAESAPARISGRVSLAPALAARVAPTDTVFVFVRAAEGPRMPLAIVRRSVADLPFSFTLDDSQAMSPQMRLSGATSVIVGARVSRSGNAMPQPGDLRGESAAIGTRVGGLELLIDAVER